jgi:hypothetical protein
MWVRPRLRRLLRRDEIVIPVKANSTYKVRLRWKPVTDPYADDPQYAGLLPPEPDILAQVREHMNVIPDRPVASRLEMGWIARMRLSWRARPLDSVSQVDALFGVPVVEVTDLRPDEWRLLDSDGKVIKEGTL